MSEISQLVVLIKGGGEVASGVAHCLHRNKLKVCITEITKPLAVTRGVTFSEAVFDRTKEIMGVTAELAEAVPEQIYRVWERGNISVAVDPETSLRRELNPDVLVDAIMVKRNTGTDINDAPLVIGLGPGFTAGKDVHMVVETNHGINLGKVIFDGEAEENTGTPVEIGGLTNERIIWAPRPGVFTTEMNIGDSVAANQTIGFIDGQPIVAPLSGILRGLLRSGVTVPEGKKLIEVDQVNDKAICNFIADKIRAIGEGVLEAIKLRYKI